jgi:hypothetical protein
LLGVVYFLTASRVSRKSGLKLEDREERRAGWDLDPRPQASLGLEVCHRSHSLCFHLPCTLFGLSFSSIAT